MSNPTNEDVARPCGCKYPNAFDCAEKRTLDRIPCSCECHITSADLLETGRAAPTSLPSNLETAARELLRLKDLKTDAEAIETSGSWSAVHRRDAMLAEYVLKRGAAWDALRRALQGETPATRVHECVEHEYVHDSAAGKHFCGHCYTPWVEIEAERAAERATEKTSADATFAQPVRLPDAILEPALARIAHLMASDPADNTPDGRELSLLAELAEMYEKQKFPDLAAKVSGAGI